MTDEAAFRWPTLGPERRVMLRRLAEHPDAPRWNHAAGDRLTHDDLAALDRFREELRSLRSARSPGPPPPRILRRIASLAELVPSFRRRIPQGLDLGRDWEHIDTMSREDVAVSIVDLLPDDADLEQLLVYRTAGTTGHALLVPHAARAAASYQPLLEHAIERHGAHLSFDANTVACFLVGAQARTVTYPTVLSAWGGAGFAKLNLHPPEWPREGSAARYFADMAPRLLTGDPISFAEMLRQGIAARPVALVSTAVAMSVALREKLARAYACPVIDWYSLTETGPIGYLCRVTESYHLLPHDLHIEALDEQGRPVAPAQRGEITVSGGRNPFLPLLRYRTGDYGALDHAPCPCGDPMPRIVGLEGRAPVLFRSHTGALVNPVDLSRILREFPFVQHELKQRADRSCELVARPLPSQVPDPAEVIAALRTVLGDVKLAVRFDPHLGDRAEGKVIPYQSELLLED